MTVSSTVTITQKGGFCNGMCVYFLVENVHLWVLLLCVNRKLIINRANVAQKRGRGERKTNPKEELFAVILSFRS